MQTYKKLRRLEANWIDGMDTYALLLQRQDDVAAVNRLGVDIMQISIDRPEAWVIMAIAREMNSEYESALHHIEKAILLSPRHVVSHQVKGSLLYAMNQAGEASLSYRNAYRISRDFLSYDGLVHCYLSLGKIAEATSTAKEALILLPNSGKAYCLAGIVMSETISMQDKVPSRLTEGKRIPGQSFNFRSTFTRNTVCSLSSI